MSVDNVPIEEPKKRPGIITGICIIGFIGLALTLISIIILAVSDSLYLMPDSYMPFFLVTLGIGIASMIGLWNMKRWAVYTYTLNFVIGLIFSLSTGTADFLSFIIPIIVIIIIWANFQIME